MRYLFVCSALIASSIGILAQPAAQRDTGPAVVLKAARTFDGESLHEGWAVRVKGERIEAAGPSAGIDTSGAKIVDLGSATLMPGLIRSSERAKRIDASPFMTDMRKIIEDHGVMVLSDAWFAGGMASKGGCILKPEDLKGVKFRAAGPTFAAMWEAAGANIVTPPSNEIYNAFQTGVVQATDTSLGTFQSMRLYEQVKCLTAPGDNALWMMYEPVLMSKKSFAALSKEQQAAVVKAGKDAQAYYDSKSAAVDSEAIKAFKDHNVEVATLNDAQFDAWLALAKKTSYAQYAKDVPDGQKLLDEALAVK